MLINIDFLIFFSDIPYFSIMVIRYILGIDKIKNDECKMVGVPPEQFIAGRGISPSEHSYGQRTVRSTNSS